MARPGPSKVTRTPEPIELTADDAIVCIEEIPPGPVTQLRCPLRGADDVGEEDRGKDAVRVGTVACAGEELLDLVDVGVAVAREDHVVVARKLDEPGAGDVLGEISRVGLPSVLVAAALEHECGGLDGR